MNINELRKLIEEVESGWKWRDLTNTNYDSWNEEFASEQMPRVIDALHEFEKVLQANPVVATAEVVEQAEPEERERLVHASKALINAAKSKPRDRRSPNRFS